MLAKSSKSRFAAIAIMILGVSTFMGTSAALATSVTVSGTVGCTATSSTMSASAVAFGAVAAGTKGSAILTPTITRGKNTDCTEKPFFVQANIATFSGEASSDRAGNRVIVAIADLTPGVFTVTADVPAGASLGLDFGATVMLSLSGP